MSHPDVLTGQGELDNTLPGGRVNIYFDRPRITHHLVRKACACPLREIVARASFNVRAVTRVTEKLTARQSCRRESTDTSDALRGFENLDGRAVEARGCLGLAGLFDQRRRVARPPVDEAQQAEHFARRGPQYLVVMLRRHERQLEIIRQRPRDESDEKPRVGRRFEVLERIEPEGVFHFRDSPQERGHFVTQSGGEVSLDPARQRVAVVAVGLGRLEKDVAGLNVAAHVPQPQPGEQFAQPLHLDAMPPDVDAPQERDVSALSHAHQYNKSRRAVSRGRATISGHVAPRRK